MQVFSSSDELRQWRSTVGQVGIVPTMGYLHAGHLSLVAAARADNEAVVVSIFVNPTQFAANEDFNAYPRAIQRDLALLEEASVEAVFMPAASTMYPSGFQTSIHVGQVAEGREGARRPGHFVGVATVVCKLLNMTRADRAYFGQKDAQQVAVVRRMTADLNLPCDIVVCPILRETDGLAMSSRNVYLSGDERRAASVVSASLRAAADAYEAGERQPDRLRHVALAILDGETLAQVDYVDISLASTLETIQRTVENVLLLSVAVRIGQPRLLDNTLLPSALNTRQGATQHLGNPLLD